MRFKRAGSKSSGIGPFSSAVTGVLPLSTSFGEVKAFATAQAGVKPSSGAFITFLDGELASCVVVFGTFAVEVSFAKMLNTPPDLAAFSAAVAVAEGKIKQSEDDILWIHDQIMFGSNKNWFRYWWFARTTCTWDGGWCSFWRSQPWRRVIVWHSGFVNLMDEMAKRWSFLLVQMVRR